MNRRRIPSRRARVWLAAALSVTVAGGAALLADAQAAVPGPLGPGPASTSPASAVPDPVVTSSATTGPGPVVTSSATTGPGPVVTSPAPSGSLLWSATPGGATAAFSSIQCTSNTFTSVADQDMGEVWQVVQPAGLERCEGVGPTVTPTSSYYLGWSSKFDITDGMSRYIFQLKCDPSTGTANHPVVLEVVNGNIELEDWTPQHTSVVLWSTPAVNDKWSTYALGITEGVTDGTIQFWYDGVKQTLSNGSDTYTGTTYDGTVDYLKWGLYHPSSGSATQWLSAIKMGTTLASVTQ